jgi:3',5'-nucleoside bisphosphate phosphatase
MIDLHIHTTATPHHSGWTPAELARYAAQHGYQWIAAADHNTTACVTALRAEALRYGVQTVSAVEIDSAALGKLWHTLVYGADPQAPALQALCHEVTSRNIDDSNRLLELLPQLGFRLPDRTSMPAVVNVAVIAALLAADNTLPGRIPGENDEEAGMRFLLTHLPEAYRPLPVGDIISVAHQLGGYAVLAHPGRSKSIYAVPITDNEIARLAEIGLDGIEVYYPAHDAPTQSRLLAAAQRHQLFVSGGSDSHFPHQPLATWQPEQITLLPALHDCW